MGNLFVNRPYVAVTWGADDHEKRVALIKIYEKDRLIKEASSTDLGISPREDAESISAFRNRCKELVFSKWMAQGATGDGSKLDTVIPTLETLAEKIDAEIIEHYRQIDCLVSLSKRMGIPIREG